MAGKYKKPFEKLKQQLKEELEEYLRLFILDNLTVHDNDEGREVVKTIEQVWKNADAGHQVGVAAFREFDLEKIKRIAEEHRQRVMGIYKAYFDRHTCLYAAISSWDPDNPQPPLIYNNIVDKFYDEAVSGWIKKEKPPRAAILIFIKENKTTEQKEDNNEHTGERKKV